VSTAPASALRDALVRWYRASARDLPWRHDVTPYRVLVSELMLQQTRVETVIPYFARFLERFPSLQDLASAELDEVLQHWQGLGYYRRARFLHAAARAAVAQGGLPSDPEGLRALPGIGAYTAGAVASIAHGVPAPAIDGNVQRVIARVDGLQDDPKKAAGRRAVEARVQAIQDATVASEVTQGLMELGATVCTPRSPDCGECPWAAPCVARATGQQEALPRTAKKKPPKPVSGVALVVVDDDRVLLGRRPEGLLGGLWEPPWVQGEGLAALAPRVGPLPEDVVHAGQIVHVFTHRRLTLDVHVAPGDRQAPIGPVSFYEELAWDAGHGRSRPLSKLAHKILSVVRAPGLPLAASR